MRYILLGLHRKMDKLKQNILCLNVAHALRFQAHLPIQFWGYCVLAASYLINRTPTYILKGKTRFEIFYKRTQFFLDIHLQRRDDEFIISIHV